MYGTILPEDVGVVTKCSNRATKAIAVITPHRYIIELLSFLMLLPMLLIMFPTVIAAKPPHSNEPIQLYPYLPAYSSWVPTHSLNNCIGLELSTGLDVCEGIPPRFSIDVRENREAIRLNGRGIELA